MSQQSGTLDGVSILETGTLKENYWMLNNQTAWLHTIFPSSILRLCQTSNNTINITCHVQCHDYLKLKMQTCYLVTLAQCHGHLTLLWSRFKSHFAFAQNLSRQPLHLLLADLLFQIHVLHRLPKNLAVETGWDWDPSFPISLRSQELVVVRPLDFLEGCCKHFGWGANWSVNINL